MKCISLLSLLIMGSMISGCGRKNPGNQGPTVSVGQIEGQFISSAAEFGIPVRMLMGVAFMESGMNPNVESAIYQDASNKVGISLAETAFGIPRGELGLTETPDASELGVQIRAYARWVKQNLDDKGLALNPNPANPEEKFEWVYHLGQMHRSGLPAMRNVQNLFALELIDTLNYGARWQDKETGETITLAKESPTFSLSDLPDNVRGSLSLSKEPADINLADFFSLTRENPVKDNVPDHIRVIHCPFSMSKCLEMQHRPQDLDKIRLGAHYLIPPSDVLMPRPLQIERHHTVVELTNSEGYVSSIRNAVVVMLVGMSGHYEAGIRSRINPKWFSDWQLETLGKAIRDICYNIKNQINQNLDLEKCMDPVDGVEFQTQGQGEAYQWGDIVDFEPSVYRSYVRQPDQLKGAAFVFAGDNKSFAAGQPFRINVKFLKGATKIRIEQASRCEADERLIWSNILTSEVRNQNIAPLDLRLFGKGPNKNGQHFFRAMVYDEFGKLTSWAIDDLFVTGYDDRGDYAAESECARY